MSYDLEIFDGDPEASEDSFRALDCRLAWHVLQEMLAKERVESDRDELLWFLPTLTVSLYIGHADDTVSSMAAAIVRSIDESESTENTSRLREDLTRILIVLETLAAKLEARLYDPQLGEDVLRSSLGKFVEAKEATGFADFAPEAAPLRTLDADERATVEKVFSFNPILILLVMALLSGLLAWWPAQETQSEPEQAVADAPPAPAALMKVMLGEDYSLSHSAIPQGVELTKLTWMVQVDGEAAFELPAVAGQPLHYPLTGAGKNVTVYLKAEYDGAYRVVSDVVSFKVPEPAEAQ